MCDNPLLSVSREKVLVFDVNGDGGGITGTCKLEHTHSFVPHSWLLYFLLVNYMKSTRGEDDRQQFLSFQAVPILLYSYSTWMALFSIIVTNSALQNNNLIYKWMVSNSDQTNPIKKNWAKEQSKWEREVENLVRRNDFILPIERRIQFPLQVAFNYCDFSNDLISWFIVITY